MCTSVDKWSGQEVSSQKKIDFDITISLRSGELDAPRIILNIVTCGQVVS